MNGTYKDFMFDVHVALDGASKDDQEQRWSSDDLEE
jgi:hypothetical protein